MDSAAKGKYKSRIGLDIGSQSVKIVELSGPSDKPTLASFGSKKISGLSKDSLAALIRSFASEVGVSAKDANISVSGPAVIVRIISMPRMTDDELAGAVRFEAEKFIPFDINDCILDFDILNKASKGKEDAQMLLAAAKREHVLQKIKTVEKAGFTVKTVDVDIFAAINSFLRNSESPAGSKTTALLNIGASYTDLSILCAGQPVFVREISEGGNELSAAIAKSMALSPDSAEALKVDPKDKKAELVLAAKPVIGSILDEVRLSFGYYENQSGRGIDEIYVSGGSAMMPGLEEHFQETFGSKLRYWDPFRFLGKTAAVPADDLKGSYVVAMGLALRGQ